MAEFNVSKSIDAQKKLVEEKSYPHFAPKSGVCWNCRKNIYEQIGWVLEGGMKKRIVNLDEAKRKTGISVDEAAAQLVTGCPHCNRSYCD